MTGVQTCALPIFEAQLSNVADEIAYNNHDVDDGLRSGLLDLASLREVTLFARHHQEVERRYPGLTERRQIHEVIRRMINEVVNDLIDATRQRLRESNPRTIEDVRAAHAPLVGFSDRIAAEHRELKLFLREHLYRHYRVVRMTSKARRVVRELFESFQADLRLLPEEHRQVAERLESREGPNGRARAVADYVAGMTDRYAILEHARVHDPAAVS